MLNLKLLILGFFVILPLECLSNGVPYDMKHLQYLRGMNNFLPVGVSIFKPFSGQTLYGPLHVLAFPGGGYGCYYHPHAGGVVTGEYCITSNAHQDKQLYELVQRFNNDWDKYRVGIEKTANIKNCRMRVIEQRRKFFPALTIVTENSGGHNQACIAFLRVYAERGLWNFMDKYPWNQKNGQFIKKNSTINTKPDKEIELGWAQDGSVKINSVRGCSYIRQIPPKILHEGDVLKATTITSRELGYGTYSCDIEINWTPRD
ncbi:hypothetical protein JV07_09965 [Salmonella enterica]|nr:hypothetical protein [Salmonella enterica]EAY4988087.1 hypothetical protein [Salmonella enterica]